jgi:hypothetical protein
MGKSLEILAYHTSRLAKYRLLGDLVNDKKMKK